METVTHLDSWDEVYEYLTESSKNEIYIPFSAIKNPSKSEMFHFEEFLSYDPRTEKVYRDNRPKNTLQVRVYRDEKVYKVQLDSWNPENFPIKHLEEDVIEHEIQEIKNNIDSSDIPERISKYLKKL